jgi:Trypsin-like peptidase domain
MMQRMWTGLIDHSTLYRALRLDVERYDKSSGKTITSGHGTGFLIDAELGERFERARFLVTNRHVMDPGFGPEGKPTQGQGDLTVSGHMQRRHYDRLPRPKSIKVIITEPVPIFPSKPNIDLAMVRFDRASMQVVDGSGRFDRFSEEDIASPWVYADGDVHAGTQILMAGYPSFGGQSDAIRPILVEGIVSSDPRFPAELEGVRYPRSALCHAFSRAGMSGAPVLAAVLKKPQGKDALPEFQLNVIGVNAGHLRTAGSSEGVISHFVTSIALLEMLADEGSSRAKLKLSLESVFATFSEND